MMLYVVDAYYSQTFNLTNCKFDPNNMTGTLPSPNSLWMSSGYIPGYALKYKLIKMHKKGSEATRTSVWS